MVCSDAYRRIDFWLLIRSQECCGADLFIEGAPASAERDTEVRFPNLFPRGYPTAVPLFRSAWQRASIRLEGYALRDLTAIWTLTCYAPVVVRVKEKELVADGHGVNHLEGSTHFRLTCIPGAVAKSGPQGARRLEIRQGNTR